MTATEAAQILGVTRQTAHRWVAEGRFPTVYKIGARPTFVLIRNEVEQLRDERT